jgi:hypothetical protein
MASGFIILSDGRCWARRWTAYDRVIGLSIEEIPINKENNEFKEWLQTRIPEEQDIECGWCFIKQDTGESIVRNFDLRELTEANQKVFLLALQRALTKMITTSASKNEDIIFLLKRILKMIRLAKIKDNPDNCSDWRGGFTEPLSGKKVGPGW